MKIKLIFAISILLCLTAAPIFSEVSELPGVSIRAYHSEPFSMARPETDILWGPASGEFLELTIDGTILNLRHFLIELDWNTGELSEADIINQLYKVENSVIVISTYLPDGIPSEKLTWSDDAGNQYEFILQADGLGTSEWIILPGIR